MSKILCLPRCLARFTSSKLCQGLLLTCFLAMPSRAAGGVFISEFLADNSQGLRTAAGLASDWIELGNNGTTPVDLSGWYLTDSATNLKKWRFPDGTTISAGGYLLVFADSSTNSLVGTELHANFSLSKDGEYLALVQADGVTVADEFAAKFPEQFEDISFGHAVQERDVLTGSHTARYRVPDATGGGAWSTAQGPFGFSSTNSGGAFKVSYYEMNSSFGSVDAAESMIANPSFWKTDRAYPIVSQQRTINYIGTVSTGNFADDVQFPGQTPGEDREFFVVVVEGGIYVPSAGLWTFAVGSDDGFRLRISGHGVQFVCEYPTDRGFDTTLGTFNFPVAGIYDLKLTFYENGGGSGLELSSATGFQEAFSPGAFSLTGDAASGIAHAGNIGAAVETDVAALMLNKNARLDTEWDFVLPQAPGASDGLLLSILCADGFVASINGELVASTNAPSSLAWNSSATASRSAEQALQWLTFAVPTSVLRTGTNTLVLTALNDSLSNAEFLIQPRLTLRTSQNSALYFKTPTPRATNSRAYTAPTPKVEISEPRGFKSSPFQVTLTCKTPGVDIRYTLDGSTPKTTSALYSGPITVTKTTTLRAAVVDPASIRQDVATRTWIFVEDVLAQGSTPPPGWPASRQVNNHVMEYGLNPTAVSTDGQRLRAALTSSIPSISLVTDLPNLFSPQIGIYVNPGNDGPAWERPVSVELIDPSGNKDAEFHIDAGLRIRGAFSRSPGNPKHSFRLFFRSHYGESTLKFPLFGDEGANEFEKVDLRTSQNYAWAFENSDRETFIRETFSRDSQRDMGMPYTRSRYYHLYINGQYWGLYQTQERGDADYAESYLGGDDDEWDCIKTTQPGYTTTASDGNFNAWNAFFNLAVSQGFGGAFTNNYWRAKGMNPDGTVNTNYPVLLDEDNLIIYMLIAYYTGDPDSPVSMWGGMPNNMYALYNRMTPTGFKWLRHDAEHSLGANGAYPVSGDTTSGGLGFNTPARFNPATLHHRLSAHPVYRQRFADLAQKFLFGDGALTASNSQARFMKRMQEIDLAIVGEAARWGRGRTRENSWLPECQRVLNGYFPQRLGYLLAQFRNRGWFPSIDAPTFSANNTAVPPGGQVRLSGSTTFYYTLDGSDPRRADGTLNPTAIEVRGSGPATNPKQLIRAGDPWRFYDAGNEPSPSGATTWRDRGYPDAAWNQGPAVLGFAGSATANAVATATRRYVNGVSGEQVTTTYLRRAFTLDSTNGVTGLSLDLLRDDGVIVYLNGFEVLRDNMPEGAVSYSTYAADVVSSPAQNTYYTFPVSARYLRAGTNVLAVELHQSNAGSSDLYFDLALTTQADTSPVAAFLTINEPMLLRARAYNGTEWSALSESALTIVRPPSDYSKLRIAEILYAPPTPPTNSPYDANDFAWIELVNLDSKPLDLTGVHFASGIDHAFTNVAMPAGGRLVLSKNVEAFATRYPTNGFTVLEWNSGNLARRGETLSLRQPNTTNILTFTYTNTWHPDSFNTGASLVAVDLAAEELAWSSATNWRVSRVQYGTPGFGEAPGFTRAAVIGNQLVLEIPATGTIELQVSTDLQAWAVCPVEAYKRSGTSIEVDLRHPALNQARSYFRVRLSE